MNILIADDEVLARAILKRMLQDLKMDINIVGEATDGSDLIEKMKLHPVDIAFIDIKMPNINGLESIRILKDSYPNTSWVILSGYSKFEYAREALELGAVRYLLKPISPDKLKKSITEISSSRKKAQAVINMDFENVILAYFYKLISAEQLKETLVKGPSQFAGGIVYIDSYLDEKNISALQLEITNKIHKIIEKYLSSGIYAAYFMLPSSKPIIICGWNPDKIRFGEKIAADCFDDIHVLIHEKRSDNFQPILITTGLCSCFGELFEKTGKIQNYASLRIKLHNSGLLKLEDLIIKNKTLSESDRETINLVIKLAENYKNRSYLTYSYILERLGLYMSGGNVNIKEFIFSYSSFISYSLGIDIKKCNSINDITNKLKTNQQKLLGLGIQPADIISQAITFIHENYMNDISIAELSEKLNISPNYLSSLFHKKTGATFMKYLTKIRLNKAYELLSMPNARVNQVARQVGYSTVTYFAQLYKKEFGVCPSSHSGNPIES